MLSRAAAFVRARPVYAAARALSSVGDVAQLPVPTHLSTEQALASSRITRDFMRHGVSGRRLDDVATAGGLVQDRWTQALQILVGAQAHVAAAFGYAATGEGIMQYRTHLAGSAAAAPPDALEELKACDTAIWNEVLLRGFAVAPRPMAAAKARDFAGRVAAAASSSDGALGNALSATLAALPAEPDSSAKAQAVLGVVQRAMADVQIELSADPGYDGDDGYVQLQAALVDHMADPVVSHATQAATYALCARAGIAPPS